MGLLQTEPHFCHFHSVRHSSRYKVPVHTMFDSLHIHAAVIHKLHRTQVFHIFIHAKVLQGRRKEEEKQWPSFTLGKTSTTKLTLSQL